ncbi:hypothetical protein ABH935_000350 [Catenulispora sp. GAS73]
MLMESVFAAPAIRSAAALGDADEVAEMVRWPVRARFRALFRKTRTHTGLVDVDFPVLVSASVSRAAPRR